mmetsp:Transcript_34170/g.69859  ORF Transcript_34170/g.69859 Transcript_34170/m.69859 type:complete len:710 (+) Transcript_34170:190-2319(+)
MSSPRTVVLTGATGQIGQHIARRLAQRGHHLNLVVRNSRSGNALADELQSSFPASQIDVHECDLSSVRSVRGLVAGLNAKLQHVDVLVNCAAVRDPPAIREVTAEGIERTFATNALAPFQLMLGLRPLLSAAQGRRSSNGRVGFARVVNVASDTGRGTLATSLSALTVDDNHGDDDVGIGGQAIAAEKKASGGGAAGESGPVESPHGAPRDWASAFGLHDDNDDNHDNHDEGGRGDGDKVEDGDDEGPQKGAFTATAAATPAQSQSPTQSSPHRKKRASVVPPGYAWATVVDSAGKAHGVSPMPMPNGFGPSTSMGAPSPTAAATAATIADATAAATAAGKQPPTTSALSPAAPVDPTLPQRQPQPTPNLAGGRQPTNFYAMSAQRRSRAGKHLRLSDFLLHAARLQQQQKKKQHNRRKSPTTTMRQQSESASESRWVQEHAAVPGSWFQLREVPPTAVRPANRVGSDPVEQHEPTHPQQQLWKQSVGGKGQPHSTVEDAVLATDEALAQHLRSKMKEFARTQHEKVQEQAQGPTNGDGGGEGGGGGESVAQRQEATAVLYPYLTGPFDTHALLTGKGYDAATSYEQSKIALRMLSWAAFDHFHALGDDRIAVHACHPGEVVDRKLCSTAEAAAAAVGASSDVGVTAEEAARCPSFLSFDRRLESMGTGPFYWNERIRLKDCEYMGDDERRQGADLWHVCHSLVQEKME